MIEVSRANRKISPTAFLDRIRNTREIHAFFGLLAEYVADHQDQCNHFTQWACSNELTAKNIRAEIEFQIDLIRNCPEIEAQDFAEAWTESVCLNMESLHLYCLFTIIEFDKSYVENNEPGDIPEISGPLDFAPVQYGYRVYKKPPAWYQDDRFRECRIRHGRNIPDFSSCDSLRDLKNYIFIDGRMLGTKEIVIKKYIPPFRMDTPLRIMICPISNKKWFGIQYNDDNKSFQCFYPNEKENRDINNKICRVIEYAAQSHAQIAVFPELAANETTTEEVRNFLIRNKEIKDEVALIFLGTTWKQIENGGINEGTLLTGSGTILFTAKKNHGFSLFLPEKQTYYSEDLADTGEYVYLLDVPGWGRISWEICKDYLEEIHHGGSLLGANIRIVSSYTEKTSEMENQAKGDARERGLITVLVNHCTSQESGLSYGGYLTVPQIDGNRNIGYKLIKGIKDCNEPFCAGKACGCMYIVKKDLSCEME